MNYDCKANTIANGLKESLYPLRWEERGKAGWGKKSSEKIMLELNLGK